MRHYIFLTLCLLVAQGHAADDGDLRPQFKWRAALSGNGEAGQLYRIKTPNDVFDGSTSFPNDLRIYDATGRQWPFFIWQPQEKIVSVDLRVEELNASTVEAPDRYYRQDLRVMREDQAEERPRHSEIQIDTPGRDYMRKVELYGSEDQATWGLVGTGYLVHYGRDANVRNSTIKYPVSDYPFLQVRVYPNARHATEELTLRHMALRHKDTKPAEFEAVELDRLDEVDEVHADRQTIILDARAKHRPVEKLIIELEDRSYARPVKVYGRNDAESAWRWLSDGEVHHLDGHAQNTVHLKHALYRYIKVELFHYDDAPLHVASITAQAIPRYIVFEAQKGDAAELFFGAEYVPRPRYDIQRRRSDDDAASCPTLALKDRVPNEGIVAQGWGAIGKWLAVVAVGLVSVYVIWIIVGMMKVQAPSIAGD